MCIFSTISDAYFTNEPVLIDYGVSYLKIASFSYLLTGFSQCYIVMMKISEHAGTAAAVSSITVLINIMLNAIFIYGAFGIESMNVRGAALATLISRVVELMLSITFSYRPGYIRLKIRELFARNKERVSRFYEVLRTDSRSKPCMGNRLYIVLYIYGTHGNRCGSGQLRRSGCA